MVFRQGALPSTGQYCGLYLDSLIPVGELPKMRRAGRTDVSDLQVAFSELTPVSEPLYAVA